MSWDRSVKHQVGLDNTVKTHLRSIYQKLGVESRSQAIERAVELRLL
jgi:ATP/maltotriose-dependent transcriptional regulator MalT